MSRAAVRPPKNISDEARPGLSANAGISRSRPRSRGRTETPWNYRAES